VAIVTIQANLSAVDEVAAARQSVCAGGGLGCNLASVGHPNVEGEAAYATAISNLLGELGFVKAANAVSSQGCMIVTAALGSRQAEAVATLRNMRDDFLRRSRLGQDFYAVLSKDYYAFSPVVAGRMRSSPEFKNRVRSLVVSPFLGFAELLCNWASPLPADAFQTVLAATLEASLRDLAQSGIDPNRISSVAAEISRLSLRRSAGATPGGIDADGQGVEPANIVNYFNSVAGRTVHGDAAQLDFAVLQPIKLYWRLLAKKITSTPVADIRSEFEGAVTDWLRRAAALASASERSGDDFNADLKLLSDVLSVKGSARHAFLASLHATGGESKRDDSHSPPASDVPTRN
jgi:hypothetical protein